MRLEGVRGFLYFQQSLCKGIYCSKLILHLGHAHDLYLLKLG